MDKKIEELASFLKKGSKIHIKKSQRGSFTSYCGGKVTNECIQRGKNSPNPKIRKKATFAANARTWKHDEGGIISNDKKANYEPTLEDIVKFATSFETFQGGPYQSPNYKGEMQTLAGFGSANPKIIELASQGKLTKDIALNEVRNHFNKIYNRLSLEVPGFDKLPSGAKLGIADIVYNGSGVDSFKRKSPNLIRAISLYDPSNPESLQAVAKAMNHSKNAGGWLGVRSSARRAMALGEYKWDWSELDKYGRQINRAQYRGPQDWKSSPYYQKYAKGGGLTYTPFLQHEEINKSVYTPFIPEITSDYTLSFPVEPVRNYTPIEQAPEKTEQEVKTPEIDNSYKSSSNSKETEKPIVTAKSKYNKGEQSKFAKDMYTLYSKELSKRGLPVAYAKWLTAQDALETGWGTSIIGNNNFGNIQYFDEIHGNKYSFTGGTDKHADGTKYSARFVNFNNVEDYIKYKVGMLSNPNSKRYRNIFIGDTNGFADRIQASGYAESKTYGKALKDVFNTVGKYLK